jgi:hypothetical protein
MSESTPTTADPIRELIQAHSELIADGNDYAYFELAYTRTTGWMAWLKSELAAEVPIAVGQGDTAEEACAAALESRSTNELLDRA